MCKNKKTIVLLGSLLTVIIATLIFIWVRYGQNGQRYGCTNFAMGTYVQQTVYGKNRELAAKEAIKQVGTLENLISWRIDNSDISKLNNAAGNDWVKLDAKTIALLQKGLEVAKKSDGAFDPTIFPISSLWDFGSDNPNVPSKEEIAKYIKYVDFNNLRVNNADSTASLKLHYTAIDLGAIGKGAACDEVVAAYEQSGADCGIVAVGGSVGIFGTKANNSAWHIKVRDPSSTDKKSAFMGTIDLTSGFISTSGLYEKNFSKDGVLYHHLLNPKTGYPTNNSLISVTIVCDNGALSDALSTACFVLGKDKAMTLLEKFDAGGIFIDDKDKVYVTENIKNKFKIDSTRYSYTN